MSPARRRGFTLIELLVVIVILALLVGLLLPAVMNAVGRANEARVAAEIQALAQALAAFKSAHGDYPPSRIVIAENGDYSTGNLGPLAPLSSRSVNYLRRFWPRINISTSGPTVARGAAQPAILDANGNGVMDDPYILTGQECLVFFLGGIPQNTSGVWSVTGFSRNPTNPFQNAIVANNRTVPDFEFPSSRLLPNLMNITARPNQAPVPAVFPGFCDPLGNDGNADGLMPFYCYFSSYAGSGYDPNDNDGGNATEAEPSGSSSSVACGFYAPGAVAVPPPPGTPPIYISSPSPNPYTNSCPVPTDGSGNPLTPGPGVTIKPRAWQNANTFQIISSGRDRYFGMGGQYLANRIATIGDIKLPYIDAQRPGANYVPDSGQTVQANAAVTGGTVTEEARVRERDNLTNFSAGRLD